jgi:hypothetical protein
VEFTIGFIHWQIYCANFTELLRYPYAELAHADNAGQGIEYKDALLQLTSQQCHEALKNATD